VAWVDSTLISAAAATPAIIAIPSVPNAAVMIALIVSPP
jgi:hypothetical protein